MAKHEAVAAVQVANWDQLDGRPGAYLFMDDGNTLVVSCPCGGGEIIGLPIRLAADPEKKRPCWVWNGNVDAPTITPSVRRLDACKWHGFLTSGEWVPCSDSGA
jgi:hypothetical protein